MDSMHWRPHSRELRKGRVSTPGHVYLVTSTTHHRRPLFRDIAIGRLLVREMRCLVEESAVDSLAWVVMPDHFHWLFGLKAGTLHASMRRLKSRSAIAVNRFIGESGRVWQAGYHDHALRAEEDIKDVAQYIVANPLRARLVTRIGDYPLWDAAWL